MGPAIPEHLLKSLQNQEEDEEADFKPNLQENQDEDEDDFCGPSPSLMANEVSVNYAKIFDKKRKKEEKVSFVFRLVIISIFV